jgi:hypothetical protein
MAKKKSMKKKNIEPCIDDPEIAIEEILVAEAIPHIDFEDEPMDKPKDEFAAEEVFIAEHPYECAEEVSIAEHPYECAEEVSIAESPYECAKEVSIAEHPYECAEEVSIAEHPYECAEEVSIAEPLYEDATEDAPVAEPTGQVATEKTYIAISKDLPVTKESREEPYTGSGSMLQEPQEW